MVAKGGTWRGGLAALLGIVVLAAALSITTGPAAAETSAAEGNGEWQMWCLINQERREVGRKPLLISTDLRDELARPWSQIQAARGYSGHRSNLGADTTRSIGSWDRAAENVGRYNSVTNLHAAFMDSSTHRTNLLDARFEYIGIGITFLGANTWGTQNFASTSRPLLSPALPLGQRFVDVCADNSFFDDIRWMYDTQVTTGYAMQLANGHSYRDFRPNSTVTRAALAAFLYRVAGATGPNGPCPANVFTDVAANDPFRIEICWMKNMGLTGRSTTFLPGATANRQAMASWMYQLWDQQDGNDFTPPANPTFPNDVPTTHPYYAAIEWMIDSGVSTGYSDQTWRPSGAVSRQAMAAFFHRFAPLV